MIVCGGLPSRLPSKIRIQPTHSRNSCQVLNCIYIGIMISYTNIKKYKEYSIIFNILQRIEFIRSRAPAASTAARLWAPSIVANAGAIGGLGICLGMPVTKMALSEQISTGHHSGLDKSLSGLLCNDHWF